MLVSIRRRRIAEVLGALAAAPWLPAQAARAPDESLAFAAGSFSDALTALGGVPVPSGQILLEVPEVAEDGSAVPVAVTSRLAGTREILIVVDGNPQPLAARFSIPEGTEAYVSARIRMARSGLVCAAVRTDAGLFAVARATDVVVGGCG